MKISRALTSRRHSGNSVSVGGGRFVPRWATTRRLGKNAPVTGSARNVFRSFVSRTHGTDLP